MKLEQRLAKHGGAGRKQARRWIVEGRVVVDGSVANRHDLEVGRFHRIECDGVCIQEAERRIGIMLYKPRGVLSATKDAHLPTVIDLIDDPDRESLHLVGRLDRWTSGLVLLTNDGNWSKALMHPDRKVPKVYEVETEEPMADGVEQAFLRGFYFHTEDITTLPVALERLGDCRARLTLHEGRYHQIKRMFHRVGNRVKSLHRTAIGGLELPSDWKPGQWRCLTGVEMELGHEPDEGKNPDYADEPLQDASESKPRKRRKARAPLPAAAVIAYGLEVLVTKNHLNETAPSGYVARLVELSRYAADC